MTNDSSMFPCCSTRACNRRVGMLLAALALLLCCALFPTRDAFAQDAQLQQAFADGAADALAKHFEPQIELKLLGSASQVPGADAQKQLDIFFGQHRPTSFSVDHQASRKNATFLIGTLTCGKSRFRVTLFFRGAGEGKRISKLQIESA